MRRLILSLFCCVLLCASCFSLPVAPKAHASVNAEGSANFQPVKTATVKDIDGNPTLHVNGKPQPLVGWFQWDWYPRMTQTASYAGIHIYQPRHTTGYPTLEVWLPEMQKIAQEDPNAYFLPVLWLGTDFSFGFNGANTAEVNVDKGASWGANSYGSKEWKNRAELFLREQIRRYEASPMKDRILGYMLTGGSTGEWFNVDTWANRDFDRSVSNTASFREWLKLEYGSDLGKLRHAWNDPAVTFESASIPAKASGDPFLNPATNRSVIDYVQYQNKQLSRFIVDLAGVVKDETGRAKLMSIYSGYTMAFGQYGPLSGELDLETLLNSPDIDLLYSPLDYTHRSLADGFTSVHGAMDSARLHGKLYVGEDDYATHIGTDTHGAPPLSDNADGSLALLWRNFGFALTKSYGLHWYDDAGYGGFNNARMVNEIRKMNQLANAALNLPRKSGAEIALVVDEFSQMVQSVSGSSVNERLRLIREELSKAGAPYDIVLLSDVLAGKADSYKLYLFANAFALKDEQRTTLGQWDKSGKTVVWLYASGYWKRDASQTDRRSADQIGEITGLATTEAAPQSYRIAAVDDNAEPLLAGIAPGEELGGSATPIPLFAAEETDGVHVLGRTGSKVTAAYKQHNDGKEVWIGSPSISSVPFYRNLAEEAGVHLYSRSGLQVNANESFVTVTKPAAGADTVYFPDARPKYDVTNDRTVQPGPDGKLEIVTTGPQTLVYYNGSKEDLHLNSSNAYSTTLGRLVVRLTGETLEHQKLESNQPRTMDAIAGSLLSFDVTGITPDGYYFYKDEMSEAPTWSSSDEAVATITQSGRLSALAPGQTVITATVGGISNSVTLTVKQPLEISLLPLMENAAWSTWSMTNGWHPYEFGTGNAFGTSNVMTEVVSEDGNSYGGAYRYEPLQSGEQVSGSLDSLQVPNKKGVKAVATFRYPLGTPEGTYNSLILEGYKEGGAGSLFVLQKDLSVTGAGTTMEVDLSAYAGQKIRIDVNVRNKSATDVTYAKIDLTELKMVYEDEQPQKKLLKLAFADMNKTLQADSTESLVVQKIYDDGSRELWAPGGNAVFYSSRPDLVTVSPQGVVKALGKGTAEITLVTDEFVARSYVHVIGDEYVYTDLLPVYAEEGTWTVEPTYASFPFGTSTEYGGASRPESVTMEDGHIYANPIVISGSASGTGVNGRIAMKVPDERDVHLTGKFGFVGNTDYEGQTATFYMRSWDPKQPFYKSYSIAYDGQLGTFDIDVSAFRGQTLDNTDIYLLKPNGSVMEMGLVELSFRVKLPVESGAAALIADKPYSVLGVGGETSLSVTELTDTGVYRTPSSPVTWSSEQTGVVSVANGRITALKPGVAIVQADMGAVRAQMVVEVRSDGLTRGQAADPYRWTSLERLPQFPVDKADVSYRYVGLHIREPVMPSPTVTWPEQAVETNESAYTIKGTSAAGSRVQIWNDRNENGWLDDQDTLAGEQQLGSGETEFAIKVQMTGKGSWHYVLTGSNLIGERSAEAVTPVISYSGSSGGNEPGSNGVVTLPDSAADLLTKLNGKAESYAKMTLKMSGNRQVSTVILDAGKIKSLIAGNGGSVLGVYLTTANDAAIEGLTAGDLASMAEKGASLEIHTQALSIPVHADRLDWQAIAKRLGSVSLSEIEAKLTIERLPDDILDRAKKAAKAQGYLWLADPVVVKLTFTHASHTVDAISIPGSDMSKSIVLSGEMGTYDSRRIPIGVAIYPNGSMFSLPTTVERRDDRTFAVIHDLAEHDIYAVIENPRRFSDLEAHWAKDEVNEMGARLVVSGTGGAKFEPNRVVQRSEFAAILVRGFGWMHPDVVPSRFPDVKQGAWDQTPVGIAAERGIVSGYGDGLFHGQAAVSREQAMVMLANVLRSIQRSASSALSEEETNRLLSAYRDGDRVAAWARESIAYLIRQGIVKGNDGHILPQGGMNRAEAAVLVRRALNESDLI
ncbi:S-layer homology domain-containing protein [Cohnella soli]|uniref:S-layer homology domain-containing protein n=1 Tax=Cohnella soli TaxID=425005 RepID=A0ABW0I2E3_9BACL